VSAKHFIAAGVLVGAVVLTQVGGDAESLRTRRGSDVIVFRHGSGTLARLRLPGRHEVGFPCKHARDQREVVVVNITRQPTGGSTDQPGYENVTPGQALVLALKGESPAVCVCDTVRELLGTDAAEGVFATEGGLRCRVPTGVPELAKLAGGVRAGQKVVMRGRLSASAKGRAVITVDDLETGAPTPGQDEPAWTVGFEWNGERVASLARPGRVTIELPCTHEEGKIEELTLQLRQFRKVDLRVGGHIVEAELADDKEARSYGLQGRDGLLPDHGMWFVFEQPYRAVFVMKTVSFPLSIAFVRDDGTIVNIEKRDPGELREAKALEAVRYVLEMEQGWFTRHGAGPGAKVEWPKDKEGEH